MTNSLHSLFEAIADAPDEQELRLRIMDAVGEHFRAQYWGLCLLNEQSRFAEVDIQGGPDVDAFVERYEKIGRTVDPVLRYVVEHHAPAHEELVLSPEGWKQCELYRDCYAYYDHEHVMMGPVVSGGRLMGGVYFARAADAPAFDFQDLAALSGLCLHLSARLATLRSQSVAEGKLQSLPVGEACLHSENLQLRKPNATIASRLTERELQIAELVAQGLTNAEIGTKLWITQNTVKQALKRMFRKLDVSARAELVAQLQNS